MDTVPDWTASPLTMEGARERTGATLHFSEASTAGSVLLLNIFSEQGFLPHGLTPQFAGAAAAVSQAMVPEGLQVDCLLEPRRGNNLVSDFGGRVLAGNRELAGPGTLRIGFVFPTVELAELARDQVQTDWVGRSRILDQPEVVALFQLQRSKLINPSTGKLMDEGFVGSLAFTGPVDSTATAPPPPIEVGRVRSAHLALSLARNQQGRLTVIRWAEGQRVGAVPELSPTNVTAGAEATRIPLRWDFFQVPPSDREAAEGIARGEIVGPTVEGALGADPIGGRFNWALTDRSLVELQSAAPPPEIQGTQSAKRWLFWSAQDADALARTGQFPKRINSGFSVEYEPQSVVADTKAVDAKQEGRP